MGLRGTLYYAGAMAKAASWHRCLREIRSERPEELARRYLRQTVRHAVTTVPYYESLGPTPESALGDFPLLSRRLLRERQDDLLTRDRGGGAWSRGSTGGSTGEPVWIYTDRVSRRWDYATDMYYLSDMLGMPIAYYLSHRRVLLWHRRRQPGHRSSITERVARTLGQCVHLEPYTVSSDETLRDFAETINHARPVVIWAFASSLYELARFAKRTNLRLHAPRLIISSVEMLYPPMRETIEEVFDCPVYDYYGAVEVGRVAAECREHRLHVFAFNSHVEVLGPEDRPAKPGEDGRLVITPLHNRAMPLLRYDIGDMARPSAERCACGSPLPVLEGLTGRVIEHFVTLDGRTVYGGYFVAMFYEHDWVAEFQVLQEDVDRVHIFYKLVPGREIPPDALAKVTTTVRDVIGAACRVEWTEVDSVPRTPIGKHLHTRSLVWEERKRREG